VSQSIHPTAIIDPSAEIGPDVTIGPFAIIGPRVVLGEGVEVAARGTVECNVRLGKRVRIGSGAIVGGQPQDLKFSGEETWVEIGDDTIVREYATINRGTSESGVTKVGQHCFVMSYVHLAHDCHLGDGVIVANGTQLAGHVTIEDRAILSGLVAVHQFVKIGSHAFVGGATRVNQDVPPYVKAVGNPVELYGLNSIGLQRHGMPQETIAALKRAYRLFFNSDLNVGQALERAKVDLPKLPEVDHFMSFVASSRRGVPA
jgi:UDP-N-acetylglucosamine acyltransferase